MAVFDNVMVVPECLGRVDWTVRDQEFSIMDNSVDLFSVDSIADCLTNGNTLGVVSLTWFSKEDIVVLTTNEWPAKVEK